MKDEEFKLPFYAKTTIFFIGLFVFFTVLYIAQGIIVPLVFATIIAIVLHPVVNFFVRMKINRVVAIAITLLLTFLVIAAFAALLFSQASRFSESWPVLVDKVTVMLNQTITDASDYFNKDPKKIHEWIAKTQGELINTSTAAIKQTIITAGSGLVILFLLPVYIFLILFYQPLLLEFIRRLFGTGNLSQVREIVTKTKTVIQCYLTYSLGMLDDAGTGFKSSKVYSQLGFGVLIKNGNLVFNTFQISISFYPLIPDQRQDIFKMNSYRTTDFGFRDFEFGKPAIVRYQ